MSKETYYQRKKREQDELVQKLVSDIRVLVMKENPMKAYELKAQYKMRFEFEDIIRSGTVTGMV